MTESRFEKHKVCINGDRNENGKIVKNSAGLCSVKNILKICASFPLVEKF